MNINIIKLKRIIDLILEKCIQNNSDEIETK